MTSLACHTASIAQPALRTAACWASHCLGCWHVEVGQKPMHTSRRLMGILCSGLVVSMRW